MGSDGLVKHLPAGCHTTLATPLRTALWRCVHAALRIYTRQGSSAVCNRMGAAPVPTNQQATAMYDYAAARTNMVEGQIRPNKVTDHRLVEAMLDIPREVFVPKAARGIAYVDEDIAIGNGRYLMEPMVFARMLQEVGVEETDVVLDIGCGTGYSTAVLARLGATVVGIESDVELAKRATEALAEVGVDNAVVMTAPLTEGYPAQAPYDVIVIEGLVAEVPAGIADQLAEGGRMIAAVHGDSGVGEVKLFQRVGGVVSGRVLFEAQPRQLPGFEPKPKFVF